MSFPISSSPFAEMVPTCTHAEQTLCERSWTSPLAATRHVQPSNLAESIRLYCCEAGSMAGQTSYHLQSTGQRQAFWLGGGI